MQPADLYQIPARKAKQMTQSLVTLCLRPACWGGSASAHVGADLKQIRIVL